jgi:membrane protease YdiL (CAAX protease family)
MKKDLKPIWLYLLIYIGVQIVAGFIIGMLYTKEATTMVYKLSGLISFLCYLIIVVTFIIIYRKEIKEKIKQFTKKDIIYTIVGSIILIIVNEVISRLLISANVEMKNQETIIEAYQNSKILMTMAIVFLAPFIEEMVFRYSFSTFIKNDTAFVIISSLVFGILHGLGVVTILYVGLGVLLALIYLRTNKNILASTIAHILNNGFAIITMFIMLK